MESPLTRLLDRYFVWLVATLASLEAFGQAAQGLLDAPMDHLLLWGMISVIVIAGTGTMELIKSARGG